MRKASHFILPDASCNQFCIAEMNKRDNMDCEVLTFITQAARDCEIRAKDVMSVVNESLRPLNPKLRLSSRIIAMGMAYYCRVGRPCNGFHELFFNRLMYVLQGVVGTTLSDLEQNAQLFAGFQFQMQVTGNRYTLDPLSIEHIAGDDMSMLQFGKENQAVVINGNNAAMNITERTKMIQGWTNNSCKTCRL